MSRPAASTFEAVFGSKPEGVGSAPGRVNLLGDHTDYNGGYVLPVTIPQRTIVEIAAGDGDDDAYSDTLGEQIRFRRTEQSTTFVRYIAGCLRKLETEGYEIPPLRLAIRSDVPLEAGLSSSAALEVATLRAVDDRFGLGLHPVHLARLAQAAEVEYAGVACGIMDQMACSVGREKMMLFLDTLTLDHELLPLPEGSELLVVDTGVKRRLAKSAYNARRAECYAAARALGVPYLRNVTELSVVERLPSPLRERARHVVTENARVLAVLKLKAPEFGYLMNESHRSLAEDYSVSISELDRLVSFLQQQDGVFGARITGAGFGGACVALVALEQAEAIAKEVMSITDGIQPRIIMPNPM